MQVALHLGTNLFSGFVDRYSVGGRLFKSLAIADRAIIFVLYDLATEIAVKLWANVFGFVVSSRTIRYYHIVSLGFIATTNGTIALVSHVTVLAC